MEDYRVSVEILSLDSVPDPVRRVLIDAPEHFCTADGQLFLLTGQTVITCEDSPAGRCFIFSVRKAARPAASSHSDQDEILLHLMTDPDSVSFTPGSYTERLLAGKDRCAVLFRLDSLPEQDLYSAFSSLVPVASGDLSVGIDCQSVCLLKDCSDFLNEEICEYAAAVIETMENEGITGLNAGISRPFSGSAGLRAAYLEALNAIRTGKRHYPHNHVFSYEQLTLERIIDSIPEEQKQTIRCELFRDNLPEKLSDEMLQTVQEFFRNDLNLTATSRQLFIHRNTLNYRLDKIKKEFGLDLRRFNDAAVFKLISGFHR